MDLVFGPADAATTLRSARDGQRFALLLSASFSFAQAPAASYRTFRPDTPGPHPAVIFLSGCDGLAPSFAPTLYERRAEHLRLLGHLVIFVDYLGRRGVKTCAGPVTHEDAARDLIAAAAWLRSQRTVDHSRITAMGWSYGGGRAGLVALAKRREGQWPSRVPSSTIPTARALEPWKSAPARLDAPRRR
jgi:dipeptidyl aminopeptidase/acylaminoacyl peptidase